MSNAEIAEHFELLAKLMDIHGENSFKTKSYSSAAFTIDKLTEPLLGMPVDKMYQLRGIGQSTGEKIIQLLQTGELTALKELLAATPPGITEMMAIKGLGPKKIAIIWKEMGIESLGELEYACGENRLAALKGFGQKTQQNVLDAIRYFNSQKGYHLWAEADVFAKHILAALRKAWPEAKFEPTGELRRHNETLQTAAILTDVGRADVLGFFEKVTDTTTEEDGDNSLLVQVPQQPRLRVLFSDTASFYKNLFLTSGSEAFLTAFGRDFTVPDAPANEEEIFLANRLSFIPAPLREEEDILERAAKEMLPALITELDIRGIIHSHSKWSDGAFTIEEMAVAARKQGFEYLVISDHSQAAQYAGGLKPEQIIAQHAEIDALNVRLAPFRIFKSIEADILGDGNLDYTPEILSSFDLVIASVHSNLRMPLEKAMTRLLTAIRNPYTAILGHMTGRLLLSREGYPVDHKQVIDACAENEVVLEINAHPRRLDVDWRWIRYAREKGVLLSIDPDAHSIVGFGDVYYGAMVAQKGGLTAAENLSSFTLAEMAAFVEKNRQKRNKQPL